MYCENCGKEVPSTCNFCGSCGAKVHDCTNTAASECNERGGQNEGLSQERHDVQTDKEEDTVRHDVMRYLDVAFDGKKYRYDIYSYDTLEDAVNYAALQLEKTNTLHADAAKALSAFRERTSKASVSEFKVSRDTVASIAYDQRQRELTTSQFSFGSACTGAVLGAIAGALLGAGCTALGFTPGMLLTPLGGAIMGFIQGGKSGVG